MAADEDGSALCTACGLCCTGALHDNAVLYPEEVERATAFGLTVKGGEGTGCRLLFELPCPRLDGTVCTIYPDRPRTCGDYRCGLLERVKNDELPLGEALPLVADARALYGEVSRRLRPGERLADARRQLAESTDPLSAELRLHTLALASFLDQHFRNKREGPWLSRETLSTTEKDESDAHGPLPPNP